MLISPLFAGEARSLTCVSPQGQSMGGSPERADVEVDGGQERHGDGRHRQRHQQLKQISKRSAEPQQHRQQHGADAQAVETSGRKTNKAKCYSPRESKQMEDCIKKKTAKSWQIEGMFI